MISVRIRMFLALCLLCGPAVVAQQKKKATAPPPPDAPTVFPLETLKVTGNKIIASEKIVAASGLKIGAPMLKDDFDTAREKLMATGAFLSVGYEFKPNAAKTGYDGVFDVAEIDQLYPYRFEDLPVPDNDLRAALRKQELILGDQIPGTPEVIGRYVREIQSLVGNKVKVTGKINSDLPGQLAIVFRPDTPKPQIAEVHFTGNKVLPVAPLMRALGEVAIGTAYSETAVRLLLDASVRPLYDARGRIRVKFTNVATSPAAHDVDGVAVNVTVDEGESYSLGAIKYAGATRQEADQMQKISNIRGADIANFDDVNAGVEKINAWFRNKGYLKCAGHVDRQIDDPAHRVDISVVIDPGPLYTMGRLEIVGLDLLSEPVIRKMWALKPGNGFEPGYPDSFLNDVRSQGIFDNLGKTAAESNIDEKTHTVDVKLTFGGAGGKEEKKERKKQP